MSQRPSACVPPPADYTPKPRLQNATNSKHANNSRGGGRGGAGGHHQHNDRRHNDHRPITFHRDQHNHQRPYHSVPVKNQPQEKFHRNDDDDYFARVEADDGEGDERNKSAERLKDSESNEGDNLNKSELGEEEEEDEDEDDPLDAYMRSLEEGTSKTTTRIKNKSESPLRKNVEEFTTNKEQQTTSDLTERGRGVRLDIDDTDDIEESYYKYVEEKKTHSDNQDEDERQDLIEYDKDGNIIAVRKVKREVEPLPPIDHSLIEYEQFEKDFYQEHEDIAKLTADQIVELRSKLEIKVSGNLVPRPVCSFAHFKFDERLMKVIRKSEYFQPTPIQAQAIPAALSGRNIIGIAVTGSGKTAAYLWPMIVHIMRQPKLARGDGPIGLVLVPTRELALQVYGEAKKFSNCYKLNVVCAYGGGSRYEQSKDLEAGVEIVVATPGRIIDLIRTKATNLKRVTYLVLDEADRFFEMGFEAQVRSICDHIRPTRQTLLFSATFKYKVEQLARTVTEDPVKIIQKTLGEANEDVTQHVLIFKESSNSIKKWDWLVGKLVELTSSGSVLIFVTRILNSEELHKNLQEHGKDTLLLHGDMEQSERNRVIMAFKRKECDIMIATDVAARGLDISHIRTVINYDVARDIDTHIHRVGRTGRAGTKGDAYTLLNGDKDKEFAGHLVRNLESSNQKVDEDLMRLAMQSHTFRKSRDQHNKSRDKRSGRADSSTSSSHHHHHQQHHQRNTHNWRPKHGTYDQHRGGGRHSSSREHHTSSHGNNNYSSTHRQDDSMSRNARSQSHDGPASRHYESTTTDYQDRKRAKWQ